MTESPAISETSAAAYCASRVRALDHDRYLTALFAPDDRRPALFALYAFNIEIAKTREVVSEPMLGRIRLQWWRETIDGIYRGGAAPRRHEVALALAEAVARHGLSRTRFDRMIDGREFDMEDRPPDTLAELVGYAAATSGELARLALEALGVGEFDDIGAGEAAHRAGIAWALVGLLRATPHHAESGRCYIPRDLLQTAATARRGEATTAAARRIADCAREHLAGARGLKSTMPRRGLAAVLPLVLAEGYLRRLGRAGYDPYADTGMSALSRQVRLAVAALRGRY